MDREKNNKNLIPHTLEKPQLTSTKSVFTFSASPKLKPKPKTPIVPTTPTTKRLNHPRSSTTTPSSSSRQQQQNNKHVPGGAGPLLGRRPMISTPSATSSSISLSTKAPTPNNHVYSKSTTSITPSVSKPQTMKAKIVPTPVAMDLNVSQLHEHVKLQNDIVTVKEQLDNQELNFNQLREELKQKNHILTMVEKDNTKLVCQISELKTEVNLLHGLLEDETQYRIQLESESREDKISKESQNNLRLANMKSEMLIKDEIIRSKTEFIAQQEQRLKSLKNEIDLLKDKQTNSMIEGNNCALNVSSNSKNCRGSLSIMQSNFTTKLQQVDVRFGVAEEKHRLQLEEIVQKHLEEVNNLNNVINEKDTTLEQFRQRQDESRLSHDMTLTELKRFKEKLKVSESKCGDLTSKLNKKTAEIMKLEQQQDAEAEYSVQVQVLEGQLDQALKMNSDLVTKLEKCKQELVETKDSLNNQDSYCKELKTKLNELAEKIQKLELQYQNSVDEKMDTNKTTTPSQDVQSIVEQQLVSIESKLAETLESLKVQEMKTITAEAQLADVTKNLGLSKVDVRILSRENNELQEQNTRLMETKTALSKENEKHCEAVKKLTIKINGLQSQLETAQTNVEIKDSEVIGISQIMRILKDKLAAAQDQQYDLSCELKEKVENEKHSKETLKKVEIELRDKVTVLNECQRKIDMQNVNLSLLREACSVMDQQLKEFEEIYGDKLIELERTQSACRLLETETKTLKETIEKTESELSEYKSEQKMFESKLNNAMNAHQLQETRSAQEIKKLQQKLRGMSTKNSELTLKIRQLGQDLEEAKLQKEKIHVDWKELEREKECCSIELFALNQKNAELLKKTELLTTELEESAEQVDDLKNRYEALCSHQECVDHEIVERNVQLKSTIRQQAKLIEYLQQQNELLLKKKEKKFQIFSNKGTDRENTVPIYPTWAPEEFSNLNQPTPSLTPVNLIREHFDVQALEKTVESMKAQLAQLQASQKSQQTVKLSTSAEQDSLPIVKKEECVLLKK